VTVHPRATLPLCCLAFMEAMLEGDTKAARESGNDRHRGGNDRAKPFKFMVYRRPHAMPAEIREIVAQPVGCSAPLYLFAHMTLAGEAQR
jgi:hypothetical protein